MSNAAAMAVIEPGMLTTVQDLGRPGHGAMGVARGGAADALSLRIGNRLVGNDDGGAALEMTLIGATIRFERAAQVVLSGGEAHATVEGAGDPRAAAAYVVLELRPGDTLRVGPILRGVRTYLCIAGGIVVPPRLDSRSTHLAGAFGGLDGRPLRRGDTLDVGDRRGRLADEASCRRARGFAESVLGRRTIRAVEGAHHETFSAAAVDTFWTSAFTVCPQSDRTGLRLEGPATPSAFGDRMPSEGMMAGAVQVPSSGQPIVLLVDHPTTGGYPVIACAAAVDLPVLGQARPRDEIRFQRIDRDFARAQYEEQERRLDAEVPRR